MNDRFHYLEVSLAMVLIVIGVTIASHPWLESWLGPDAALYVVGVIVAIVTFGVITTVRATKSHMSASSQIH